TVGGVLATGREVPPIAAGRRHPPAGVRRDLRGARHADRQHRAHPAALPHPAAGAARRHRGGGGGWPVMSAPRENDEALLARLGAGLHQLAPTPAGALLARLAAGLDELDPMPAEVVTEGRALFGLRRLDEELAELVRDSAED